MVTPETDRPTDSLRVLVFSLLAGVFLGSCGLLPLRESEHVRKLTLLYTNDEHGWMESWDESAGASGMLWRWRNEAGMKEDQGYLILSGGDMWTGPAVSTLTEGRSMVEVMNALGYDAAAIGNHDFDFGVPALMERAGEAQFPFLSANVVRREDGSRPEFAQPYSVLETNQVRIGVIGLTTVETSVDTRAYHVQPFRFLPYREVLPGVVADLRKESVDLIIVIGHVCNGELQDLAEMADGLGLPLLAGGHCHEEHVEQVDGVYLIESGYFLRGYAQVELWVDTDSDAVLRMNAQVHRNPPGVAVAEIDDLVSRWRTQLDPSWTRPLGFASAGVQRGSVEMETLLTTAWLRAVPDAQVVIASPRYVQQSLLPGVITPASVVGVLPVDNSLMLTSLVGMDLEQTVRSRDPLLGGARQEEGGLVLSDGRPIDPQKSYRVLIPDVIYYGANYYHVQELDPQAYDTGIDWRDPVIEYLAALQSSEEQPLEELLEGPAE